jgi:cytochrome c peroxidase
MPKKPANVPYLPLESWNRRWDLIGTQVQCKACHAMQEGGYAFVHRLQCSTHTTVAQYPLRELHQVLKDQIDRGLA